MNTQHRTMQNGAKRNQCRTETGAKWNEMERSGTRSWDRACFILSVTLYVWCGCVWLAVQGPGPGLLGLAPLGLCPLVGPGLRRWAWARSSGLGLWHRPRAALLSLSLSPSYYGGTHCRILRSYVTCCFPHYSPASIVHPHHICICLYNVILRL